MKTTRNILLLIISCLSLQACVTTAERPVSYNDPWEPMNRAVFSFNDTIDQYALKPVAKGYKTVTPKPIRGMVSNFFSNLGEVRNTLSALIQLKGGDVLTSFSRLAINSTIGMLGLVDVASPLGIERKYSDFGMAFANWGIASGPYVVLPLLGPQTLRSGVGILPERVINPVNAADEPERWYALGVSTVNARAHLLDAEDLVTGDRYSFIRDAYLQRREFLITGKPPVDDF